MKTNINKYAGFFAFLFAISALADKYTPDINITTTPKAFGHNLAINGTNLLVGANTSGDYGSNSGLAFLIDTSSGTQTVFSAPNPAGSEFFGYSVDVLGNTAVIGAINKYAAAGAVYLYNLQTGTRTELRPIAATGARAGSAVAIDGTTVLIGARTGNSNKGAVYVYDMVSETYAATPLTASDGANNDYFGAAVDISGNTAVVGAYNKTSTGGAAYLYDLTTGGEIILNPGTALNANACFGRAVAIDGGLAVVGAQGETSAGGLTMAGAVYLYDTGGNPVRKLTAPNIAKSTQFGVAVGISGNNLLIGANGVDSQGAVYLFDASAGTETLKIMFSGTYKNCNFGAAIGFDGDNFAVGTVGANNIVWSGSINSMTTLDDGSSKTISELSFQSSTDWIIGGVNDGSCVMLSGTDTAVVTNTGRGIYIGQTAGADNNALNLAGTVRAAGVFIGAAGNAGNTLHIQTPAQVSAENITLAAGNIIAFDLIDGSNATINISNTLTLAGSLHLINPGGDLAPGDEFHLFAAGSIAGTFTDIAGPAGVEWDISDLYTAGIIRVFSPLATYFVPQNDEAVIATTQTVGAAYSIPTPPVRDGYTFGGWYTDVAGAGDVVDDSVFVPEPPPLHVYANWTDREFTHIRILGYLGTNANVTVPLTIAGLPVVKIGNAAFSNGWDNASVIRSMVLTSNVTTLGVASFYGSPLTDIDIHGAVTVLPESVFAGCSALCSFDFSKISSIGENAFYGSGLSKVRLDGVSTIAGGAFCNNAYMTHILFRGNAPELTGNLIEEDKAVYYLPPDTDEWADFAVVHTNTHMLVSGIDADSLVDTGAGFGFNVNSNVKDGDDIELTVLIEKRDTLTAGSWEPFATNNPPVTFIDSTATNEPSRFYRATKIISAE